MTIADMSLITAEVRVDETDIISIRLGQTADVTIDAMPSGTFRGRVIEIGNTAILRSTGLAASQSAISSQEAKDFKVVVALDSPPEDIRPGLSCTAKITTATRQNTLTIPIQALTTRDKADLEPASKSGPNTAAAAVKKGPRQEVQGVFVVSGGRVVFRNITTGITGATDIEVADGLKEGDQIVVGPYKVVRTLRNQDRVTIDNKASQNQS
jgi:HlyD family secretion protein